MNETNNEGFTVSDQMLYHPSKNLNDAFSNQIVSNSNHYSTTTNFDKLKRNKDANTSSKKKDKFRGMISECNYEIKYSLNTTTNRRNRLLVCKHEG